ncbi:sensor histidine kinase [Granulicella arctica]|uniref:Ligand-binding sensor domain-containing protein/signal transduction histidine kinase n=1 Tax=Granulicella arctica TaxID=940613 RepID=A0A7Y9TMQ3_9BACT|nr:sensor histidine kinase [Granulicella arctica]NYF81327.1 ligand-binding sensor domain-containing protein/signal transduction histidine kinase [Granulicella arctica]
MTRKSIARRILIAASLLDCAMRLFAMTEAPPDYIASLWLAQDGLPSETIQAFAQTPDHYLWIGTLRGLVRFDGYRFVHFDSDNISALKTDSIFCLKVTRDGALWIGTEGGGLIRYQNGAFRVFSANDGLTNNVVRAVYEDNAGNIWVGTDSGLFRFFGERFKRVDGSGMIPAMSVHAITGDSRGGIWVGGTALVYMDREGVRNYRLVRDISSLRVKSILETRDGSIWVGAVSGLYRLQTMGGFKHVDEVPGTVRVLRETSDGALWAGTIGNGLYVNRTGRFVRMNLMIGLSSNTVLNLYEDQEMNIWVGSQGGMLRLTKSSVSIYPLPGASDSDFGNVYQDRDGTLWICSNHLFHMKEGVLKPHTFPGLAGIKVRLLMRDEGGALWVGTDGKGVFHQSGNMWVNYLAKDGLGSNFPRAMIQTRDGSVWIGTDGGVSHWTPRGFKACDIGNGFQSVSVMALLEDHAGDIWMGTFQGLKHLQGDRFVGDVVTEAVGHDTVLALHEDRQGVLWIGTNRGLYRYKSGKFFLFTTNNGLVNNLIYSILENGDGDLWLGGPNGASLQSWKQLEEAANHRLRSVTPIYFASSLDAGSAEIFGSMQPAGAISRQGDVWFPSNKGLVHIAANRMERRGAFPLAIDRVVVDGREVSSHSQPIVLSPRSSRVEISYAPILLRSQAAMLFRTKLEGFDQEWRETSARRTAEFDNLAPGHYVFRVEAWEAGQSESKSVASLEFVQKAYFYRRPWFLFFCGGLLAALAWGAYRFRIQRIKMRFRLVLEERSRLAREMHDTVLQGCTNVSALLEAASSMEAADPVSADEMVDLARTQVRTTIGEARQAIWDLRRSELPGEDIVRSLQRIADQMNSNAEVPILCEVTGKQFPIEPSALQELLMITREALHNSVMHGQPREIVLRADFSDESLVIQVCDDGHGFDCAGMGQDSGPHFGIQGMKERARRIGAIFSVSSRIGVGTQVGIEISRKRASSGAALRDV